MAHHQQASRGRGQTGNEPSLLWAATCSRATSQQTPGPRGSAGTAQRRAMHRRHRLPRSCCSPSSYSHRPLWSAAARCRQPSARHQLIVLIDGTAASCSSPIPAPGASPMAARLARYALGLTSVSQSPAQWSPSVTRPHQMVSVIHVGGAPSFCDHVENWDAQHRLSEEPPAVGPLVHPAHRLPHRVLHSAAHPSNVAQTIS